MNRIGELRTSKNMTREELAYRMGVSITSIFNWEKEQDIKKLSYKNVEMLSYYLDVPMSFLFGENC